MILLKLLCSMGGASGEAGGRGGSPHARDVPRDTADAKKTIMAGREARECSAISSGWTIPDRVSDCPHESGDRALIGLFHTGPVMRMTACSHEHEKAGCGEAGRDQGRRRLPARPECRGSLSAVEIPLILHPVIVLGLIRPPLGEPQDEDGGFAASLTELQAPDGALTSLRIVAAELALLITSQCEQRVSLQHRTHVELGLAVSTLDATPSGLAGVDPSDPDPVRLLLHIPTRAPFTAAPLARHPDLGRGHI
jgi:hypothetical protein